MAYNPYLNLVWFAGFNVLIHDDPYAELYPVRAGFVIAGAGAASVWMIEGKTPSRNEVISLVMDELRNLIDLAPFAPEVARNLITAGFDWIIQYEVASDEVSIH